MGQNSGVVCATFVTHFVSERLRKQVDELVVKYGPRAGLVDAQQTRPSEDVVQELTMPSYTEVVDHIEHIVKLAGIDHVGLGSDYGVISTTPVGLEDCSKLPVLTEEMLHRGYSEEVVRKVLGETVLRVMEDVIGQ